MFAELVAFLHRESKSASQHPQKLYTWCVAPFPLPVLLTDRPHLHLRLLSNVRRLLDLHRPPDNRPHLRAHPRLALPLGATLNIFGTDVPTDARRPARHERPRPHGRLRQQQPAELQARAAATGHMIQFRAESSEDGTKITLTTRTSGMEPKMRSCPWSWCVRR